MEHRVLNNWHRQVGCVHRREIMRLTKFLAVVAVGVLAFSPSAHADTITFDELPNQPVNGLTFNGVTFGFTIGGVASVDARFNAFGPGAITHVQDPSLEGDILGLLILFFAQPVSSFDFGMALLSTTFVGVGANVLLFDPDLVFLGNFPLNVSPLVSFTEGLFTFNSGLVRVAVINFNEAVNSRFAVDNLNFTPVPAPGTLLLLGSGLTLLAGALRRRSRKA